MAAILPAAAIGAAVGAELPKFFNDSLDQFGSGEGLYLRDGEPTGIVAKVGQAVGRAYCRSYDAVSAEYPSGRGERIEAACRPYLDSIGSAGGPGLVVPFPGGQCPERYLLTVTVTAPQGISGSGECVGTQSVTQGAGPYWGPIISIDRGPDLCDSGPGIAAMYTITAFSDPGGQRSQTPVTSALALEAYDVVVVSTERVDGEPDDCGDPPPVPVTPNPNPNPQPPPFRFSPSPDLDINIDVNLNPDGTFNFNIGTGPIDVDPFADGDDDGGGGPGDGGDPTPEPGEPGDSQDTGAGDDGADGDAPEGKVLTGVKIDILEAPPSRRRFTQQVDRGVAYVYMGTPEEGLALEPTGATMRSGQFFFAQKDYLTRHSVRANVGYNLRVTPYYRDKEE